MDPKIWGPRFWFSLHTVTFTYPFHPDIEHKERIKNFFNSLEYILPCSICRVNYSKKIRKHPIDNHLHTRKDLVFWFIDIHNMVNVELGKRTLSYDEVLQLYENAYQRKIELENQNNEKGCPIKECSTKEKEVIYIPLLQKTNYKRIMSLFLFVFIILFFVIVISVTYYGTRNKT